MRNAYLYRPSLKTSSHDFSLELLGLCLLLRSFAGGQDCSGCPAREQAAPFGAWGGSHQGDEAVSRLRDFRKLSCPRGGILHQEMFSWRNEDGIDRRSQ